MKLAAFLTLLFAVNMTVYDVFAEYYNAYWRIFYYATLHGYIASLCLALWKAAVIPQYKWIFGTIFFYFAAYFVFNIVLIFVPGINDVVIEPNFKLYDKIVCTGNAWLNGYLVIVTGFVLYHIRFWKHDY